MLAALAAPVTVAPGEAAPQGRSLCSPGAPVIFECGAGAKRIAVCGHKPHYRFGAPSKVEMVYPAASSDLGLSYANRGFSGGGEAQIVFDQGDYRYIVYSSTVRTGFTTTNDPAFEAGVAVQKNGKTVSTRKCTMPSDAAIDLALAQSLLPETQFVER